MFRAMVLAVVPLAFSAAAAMAVDEAVKQACRDDYHVHCDKLEVGSEELRTCMRTNATKLSKECLKALVDHNEVTKADVEKYLLEMEQKAKAQQ